MNHDRVQHCVLMAEDEMNLALLLEDLLVDAGYRVLRAARLSHGLALLDDGERVDVAILDINLAGVQVFPLAEALRERGIPFLFASGYGAAAVPSEFGDCPVLQKPYTAEQICEALAGLLDQPA